MADQDPKTTLDDAHAWATHTTSGSFDVTVFPGGHFFLSDQTAAVITLLDEHFRRRTVS